MGKWVFGYGSLIWHPGFEFLTKSPAFLHAREQQNGVYRETSRRIALDDGRHVDALVYLADPRHRQYAGRLDHDEQLKLVRQGQGQAGPNVDYVVNTYAHLMDMGIQDHGLDALVRALKHG